MDRKITFRELREMFLKDQQSKNEARALLYDYKDFIIKYIQNKRHLNFSVDEIHDAIVDVIKLWENQILDNKLKYDDNEYVKNSFLSTVEGLLRKNENKNFNRLFLPLIDVPLKFNIESNDIETKIQLEDDYKRLYAIMQKLSIDDQLLLYLRFFLDMGLKEVEYIFQTKYPFFKAKQSQLLYKLRRRLEENSPSSYTISETIRKVVEVGFEKEISDSIDFFAEKILKLFNYPIYGEVINLIKVDRNKVTIQIECPESIVDFVVKLLEVIKYQYPIISIKKILNPPDEIGSDCINSKITLIKDKKCKVVFENHLKNGEPVIAELGNVLFALYTFIIARPQGIEIKKRGDKSKIFDADTKVDMTDKLLELYCHTYGHQKNKEDRERTLENTLNDKFVSISTINKKINDTLSLIDEKCREKYQIKHETVYKIPIAYHQEYINLKILEKPEIQP